MVLGRTKYYLINCKIVFICLILFLSKIGFAQNSIETNKVVGKITFQSSKNVYVQFESTEGIAANDTLFILNNNKLIPALIVNFISSKSIAAKKITGAVLNDEDLIIAISKKIISTKPIEIQKDTLTVPDAVIEEQKNITKPISLNIENQVQNNVYIPKSYFGRFSVQSISSFSNSGGLDNLQRWRYSFSINKSNFLSDKLSFSNYMVFAYTANKWSEVTSNLSNNLKIYDLTLTYKLNEETTFWLGRHINGKIGNLGAVDGLQAERQFGNFYAGLLVGSRPNIFDYNYNIKMFEFGGYLGLSNRIGNGYIDNILAAFQQTNNMNTDRRFLYFQHSNNLLPMTNIFFSSEIDLYKKEKGVAKSTFDLTSLYLSIRYSPSRYFSISTSYDARKNVIYYETYKFLIDTLFQNELRQGFRVNANIRPFDKLFVGLSAGYRNMSGDLKPSRNYGGYLNYSELPLFKISPSISYTKIISSYVEGSDIGLKFNKYLYDDLDFSIGYRRVEYNYTTFNNKTKQNILSADLSYLIFRNLNFSVNYEGVFEKSYSFSRVFIDLTTRF